MNSAGRILVVDDEPNAVKVLSAILANDGYDVSEATDGKSAIRTVSQKDIDLVITDIKMPGMSGMQLFEYLHSSHPDIPIIFLTAYGTIEDAVDALTLGSYLLLHQTAGLLKTQDHCVESCGTAASKEGTSFIERNGNGEK